MRAARLLPSWNIGQFVLAAEDGLSNADCGPSLAAGCRSGGRAAAPVAARISSGVQAFRNSRRADAETIGDHQGAATIPPGTCSTSARMLAAASPASRQ
jgi:hypothetical protein